MEYVSVIVDELGDVVAYCSDLSEKKIDEMLEQHQEWRRTCLSVY